MDKDVNLAFINILVVDDDIIFLKMFENFIGRIGCQGVYVDGGKKAIAALKQQRFDICFMDILMPEMNGVETATIIREEVNQKMPIIALTTLSMKTNKEKCLGVGMNDYINKPIDILKLKALIETYGLKS